MKLDKSEKLVIENKIPKKIKKVIKIMEPNTYQVTYYECSDKGFRYNVYLNYDNTRFDNRMFFDRIGFEKTLEDVCKKEKALFFITDYNGHSI